MSIGFFRTKQIDNRWYLIDPQGNKFISLGVDSIKFLPLEAWGLGYSPYNRAITAKYGGIENWAKATAERLKKWGFNTIGSWSDPVMFRQGIPYTVLLNLSPFTEGPDPLYMKGCFPDVFSESFKELVEARAKEICTEHRDNPMLIGYFLENEMNWLPSWTTLKYMLERFLLLLKPGSAGRKAAVEYLIDRYKGDLHHFNTNWDTSLKSFADLNKGKGISTGQNKKTEAIREDNSGFLTLVARKYFEICVNAVKAVDKNHLILGVRFAGRAPDEAAAECGRFCDVVTINTYESEVPRLALERIYELAQKPIMITEFSFKAADSGLPNWPGRSVPLQRDRAVGYERFVKSGLALPFIVGFHWFMYTDEPKEGRVDYIRGVGRHDRENSNFGIVNINDEEWKELVECMKRVNTEITSSLTKE